MPDLLPAITPSPAAGAVEAKVDWALNLKTKDAFSRSEWNMIVRAGLLAACEYWIANYLPLRFQAYARAMGIYQGKKRKGLPLVHTGNLRAMVAQTTRVSRLTATASTQVAVIHIPMPNVPDATPTQGHQYFNYASNPVVQQTLSVITPTELARMSEICAAVMAEMIESASLTTTKARAGRMGTDDVAPIAAQAGGKIKARLQPQHRMTPKQLRQRLEQSVSRPRLTLRDFHRRTQRIA